MVKKKPHWTQTPEGKERMAVSQRVAWQVRKQKKAAKGNGHAVAPTKSGRTLAKEAVNELAIIGAKTKLARLESEAETLRLFIDRMSR